METIPRCLEADVQGKPRGIEVRRKSELSTLKSDLSGPELQCVSTKQMLFLFVYLILTMDL